MARSLQLTGLSSRDGQATGTQITLGCTRLRVTGGEQFYGNRVSEGPAERADVTESTAARSAIRCAWPR